MKKMTMFGSVIFGFLFLVGPASAASIRCGTHLIMDGQRNGTGKYEVSKKCGSPTERYGNTWIYDRPGEAKKILHFNDSGRLLRIGG
jgi:hypothetical protein